MIYNFYGEAKGKTSGALGTIVRALGHGQRVRAVFFMKHWKTSETDFFERLGKLPGAPFDVEFYKAGDNDFIFDEEATSATLERARGSLQFGKIQEKDENDVKCAQMGYLKALSYLDAKPFLLVLDEINIACAFGLVSDEQVRHLMDRADEQGTHLVLTGRNPPEAILRRCDLVTEMRKVKHPFDAGVYAVKGLDY